MKCIIQCATFFATVSHVPVVVPSLVYVRFSRPLNGCTNIVGLFLNFLGSCWMDNVCGAFVIVHVNTLNSNKTCRVDFESSDRNPTLSFSIPASYRPVQVRCGMLIYISLFSLYHLVRIAPCVLRSRLVLLLYVMCTNIDLLCACNSSSR